MTASGILHRHRLNDSLPDLRSGRVKAKVVPVFESAWAAGLLEGFDQILSGNGESFRAKAANRFPWR